MTETLTDKELQELHTIGKELGLSQEEIDHEINGSGKKAGVASPTQQKKDSMLEFYRDVLVLDDPDHMKISKTGNLNEDELGGLSFHARGFLDVAGYAESEGLNVVANYLRKKADIWFTTGLSKNGFFLRLPMSNTNINKSVGNPRRTVKKGLFGSQEIIENEGEEL